MAQVIRPAVPYKGLIYDGIHEGKKIKIIGSVPRGADRFTVNLMNGPDTNSDDRPLHISIRFPINTAVRNIYHQCSWDREERSGCFPFTIGQDFTMVITVERDAYQISVHGRHCWSFAHRLPFTRARYIFINGDVSVEKIEFINKPIPTPAVVCPPSPSFETKNCSASPCIFPIHGGIRPGMSIYITGRPTPNPYRFTISVQQAPSTSPHPDVALHFDVRFYDSSIVRNSRYNDIWYCEETHIPHFPFKPASDFSVIVKVQSDMYVIMVNGEEFVTFRHRLTNFSYFDTLSIQNDVVVTSIRLS